MVEANAFAAGETALEAVVELREFLAFAVRDEDEFEVVKAVEVVQQAFVFQLIDFVEDDDVLWAVVLSEALEKFVYRLAVDIDGGLDAVKRPVEALEPGAILPAIHVLSVYVEHLLAQLVHGEPGYPRFPQSRRADQQRRLGWLPASHGIQRVEKVTRLYVLVGDLNG